MKQFFTNYIFQRHSQEAIRDQRIELKEIEAEHLGTEKEHSVPEKKADKTKGAKSW